MECCPDLTFTATHLPPLLCDYMPRTAAEAAEVVWRLHVLLHHRNCQESNGQRGCGWLRTPLVSTLLVRVQPRVPPARLALLVPFVPASKGDTGSNPFPKSWISFAGSASCSPLHPEVKRALREKAAQTECSHFL